MIEIDDKIVSTDILTECFLCDYDTCKGECCIEGDSGAPLEEDEIDILEESIDIIKGYLSPDGLEEIERSGVFVVDSDGDYTTPLIRGRECAYTIVENGYTLCAIERAYLEGKITYQKPISCHLYPIRTMRFSNGTTGLNYHRWTICNCAVKCGKEKGVKIYQALKSPIIRAFGEEFYTQLECAEELINQSND